MPTKTRSHPKYTVSPSMLYCLLVVHQLPAPPLLYNFATTPTAKQTPSLLRQVPAGPGLLRSVGLSDAEHISQGWEAGLQVKLGGLCQVGLFPKVIQLEEGGASLHLSLDQGWWRDLVKNTTGITAVKNEGQGRRRP